MSRRKSKIGRVAWSQVASYLRGGGDPWEAADRWGITPALLRAIAESVDVVVPDRPRRGPGRPITTGRGRTTAARSVTIRLSAADDRALTSAAGDPSAVGRYLREAGLILPAIVGALESAGDTLTEAEAVGIALGLARSISRACRRALPGHLAAVGLQVQPYPRAPALPPAPVARAA